jgi:hypothetical protein
MPALLLGKKAAKRLCEVLNLVGEQNLPPSRKPVKTAQIQAEVGQIDGAKTLLKKAKSFTWPICISLVRTQ